MYAFRKHWRGVVAARRGGRTTAAVHWPVTVGATILLFGLDIVVGYTGQVSLGHAGILLNLFNLIPVSPLDGGRVAGAFSRTDRKSVV